MTRSANIHHQPFYFPTFYMTRKIFKGLYLNLTGCLNCYSFVTFTPKTREQMILSGDLGVSDEYFNPVIFDFLLFLSEHLLDLPSYDCLPIKYDDITVICSRQRGDGSQREYLINIRRDNLSFSKKSTLDQIRMLLSDTEWKGYFTNLDE